MHRDAAHVYDLVYEVAGKDYAAEAAIVVAQIKEWNPSATSLLDVACGTGRHLAHLRGAFEVAGVDVSNEMLAQARARLPGVPLATADMQAFDLGRSFDAVVCLFSSVGYLTDAGQLAAAIGCMAGHLSPGGVLIVDGWVRPDAWKEPGSVHAISGVSGDIAFARVVRSTRDGRCSTLDMDHLVATSAGTDHLEERHQLTLFTHEEYVGAFESAGLIAEVVLSPMPDRDRYIATLATEPA